MVNKLTILSGAGISVESGLKTFRGENGLWEGYDIMQVASIEGWNTNREIVLEFYNARRKQLKSVAPNEAHFICSKLEQFFDVEIITQNVDDLHERAESTKILHLHGSLLKAQSTKDKNFTMDWSNDLNIGDKAPDGSQLRPQIVWFGEEVPLMSKAAKRISESDIIVIVGTSMQVYPAASLISYASREALIVYIDPEPQINYELKRIKNLILIAQNAVVGMKILYEKLTIFSPEELKNSNKTFL